MRKCWILDDQYGKKLYEDMINLYPAFEYPVKDNIRSPLPYVKDIDDGDLILLDNYFPGDGGWESELGDTFLGEILDKKIQCKIICISDYGKVLKDKYFNWEDADNQGYIIGWCPSKSAVDIDMCLKN